MNRKHLLQLVVSNVLKNQETEIKSLAMDQLFGQDSPADLTKLSHHKLDEKTVSGLKLPGYLTSKFREQSTQTDPLLMIDFLE